MAANKSKQIEVNSASIVDLKAELFRKQEELRLERNSKNSSKQLSSSTTQVTTESTDNNSLYDKRLHNVSKLSKKTLSALPQNKRESLKNQTSQSRSTDDLASKQEDDLALVKSRTMLEKKAKLYEQMASGSLLVDPENEDLLVNFEQKCMDSQLNSSENCDDGNKELVEYEDEFGRTRLVKRADLHLYQASKSTDDKEGEAKDRTQDHQDFDNSNDDFEDDQWERTDDSYPDVPFAPRKSNIHYEDVREGEIRDHGVAFFNFAADEETRAKQMEMLEQMRRETEDKKSEKQRIKDKRKQMLRDRLAKVAAR